MLACTHYPAIIPVLREFVSEKMILIDPAGELVSDIAKWRLPEGGPDIFLTSGNPGKMRDAAWSAFGVRIRKIRKVTL